jgi:dipeptidyl aminopeptidase/acylaminoacyl peptidase
LLPNVSLLFGSGGLLSNLAAPSFLTSIGSGGYPLLLNNGADHEPGRDRLRRKKSGPARKGEVDEMVTMMSFRLNSSPRFIKSLVLVASVLLAVFAAPSDGGTGTLEKTPWDSRQVQVAPSAPSKVLTPEMILNRRFIGDLRLSPDGNRLAMVVSEPVKGSTQRRNIWVYDIAASNLKPFTAAAKADTRPRWSPDGRTLAFLSDREGTSQIYLIPADGGEARALTESKTGINSFEWSPDGKKIAILTTAPKTEEEEKKEKDKDDPRIVGKPEDRTLLQAIDIESKALTTIIKGAWRVSEFLWTPDGKELIVVATDNPQQELFSEKIYKVDAAGGEMAVLASPPGPFGNLKISPDGTALAYVGSRGDGPQPHDLFVQPLAGGPARNLTGRSLDRPVGDFSWENPNSLLILVAEGFGEAFYNLDLDGGAEKADWASGFFVSSYAKAKNLLAFAGETAVEAAELYVAPGSGQAKKVSHLNKDWDDLRLHRPEIVRYPSFDKRKIEASLIRPGNAPSGVRLPTVILVHGGPTGAWMNRFEAWGQLLAARGFAVLYPNILGSTGYGYEFMVLNRHDWGGGDFKDVLAGADWLVKEGIADPNRIGIGGWSYGGYMAAWAVTQTTLFRASVSGAPMTDLAMEYGTEEAGINSYDTWFMGNPYENLPLFTERSPVTYVKRVKTPTLILCGENDATDPVGQCYQFHRGLRRFGVETEFVVYPREGHGIREERHRIDMLNRIVGWFEKHLKK